MLNKLIKKLYSHNAKIAIIGLGYVGLPIALAFSKKLSVIGFDINKKKIQAYKDGNDVTGEVGSKKIVSSNIFFSFDAECLEDASVYIVTVPTPVNDDYTPDLSFLKDACNMIGKYMQKDSVVIFESTVYPGVTEEICIPILEEVSGLKSKLDFKTAYSPERINPGDKVHTFENTKKIVSGIDNETTEFVAELYNLVLNNGVYRATSIKVAEAAKVIENTQRDLNIALMNELSIIFHRMNIDTQEVIEAASTKWNFIKFTPGLVGGHCVGVDPYYLTYKAETLGYHSRVITSGRRLNDSMGKYVAENAIKLLLKTKKSLHEIKVGILGFTFKENCSDTRNSRVYDIICELKEYGITPMVCDPFADAEQVERIYGISLNDIKHITRMDLVIVAVAHDCFANMSISDVKSLLSNDRCVLMDLKKCINPQIRECSNIEFWCM